MRTSLLPLAFLPFALACGVSSESESSEDAVGSKDPSIHLTILESKVVFDSKPEAFTIQVPGPSGTLELPCRDRYFAMESPKSLFEGWSVKNAAAFADEAAEGTEYRDYTFASCRDASTEVLAWFGEDREYELSPTEQLLDDDYKPSKLPLLVQVRAIGSGKPSYFACSSQKKVQIGETENSKKFDISMACKSTSAPSSKILGPLDFLAEPGPFAAQLSYDGVMHPAVTSDAKSFAKVKTALLAKVAAGKYAGAMSTLAKTCGLEIQATGDTLTIDHTIDSSGRKRHLELKPEALLGFIEGDLYEDVNHISGEPVGTFASAEFVDPKNGSFVVRFESNDKTLEKQIVRIDGSEAYCRRLEPSGG